MSLFCFFATNIPNKCWFINRTLFTFTKSYNASCINKTVLIHNRFSKDQSKKLHITNVYKHIFKPSTKELKLKEKDNIPEDYKLIYRVSADNYLLAAQLISGCSMFAMLAIGLNKCYGLEDTILYDNWTFISLLSQDKEMLLYIISFIIANISLQITINRFPNRIYCNDKTNQYITVYYGIIPFQSKQFEFTKGEIKRAPVTGVLPWRDSRYIIANRKWVLLDNGFKTGFDLENMLEKNSSKT